jgi:hypothetical protein
MGVLLAVTIFDLLPDAKQLMGLACSPAGQCKWIFVAMGDRWIRLSGLPGMLGR